ncbi:class I SAM-dependent methyltransferase [Pseudoxanthomonas sp. LH2527]|uniref:class I SAM-dependent methyltransferase n=1 Tax=Pseudoxanthomonas sp. LH2527 TaxID=2923249 RepID=UPI001F1343FD|nr:class I SAM-dependent methyltransferase [Pseudoxanthomonas sp. LH2527]MCH6482978.1 class I SAM-dependent methyltransferase [Pseudoxanthomonas sp. LH2527]
MNLEHIHLIRDRELACVIDLMTRFGPARPSLDILDVGAGSGRQAARLAAQGHRVSAVDVETSAYAADLSFPVSMYDGRVLPFPDGAFDVVVSSNVLEHVSDLDGVLAETKRVLRADGIAIHVLPTPVWRTWTTMAHGPWVVKRSWQLLTGTRRRQRQAGGDSPEHAQHRASLSVILPGRHGERGNVLTESWYFSRRWWSATFRQNDWIVVHEQAVGLFYTGAMVFATRLHLEVRQALARALGSATRAYVLRPAGAKGVLVSLPVVGDN